MHIRHQIASIDQMVVETENFSFPKLDIKGDFFFHQIELDQKSQETTIFITLIGDCFYVKYYFWSVFPTRGIMIYHLPNFIKL